MYDCEQRDEVDGGCFAGREGLDTHNFRTSMKVLSPFTRDTFSSCIKATYCEIDGVPTPIFKNPKDGGFKKSQKGCCIVNADFSFTDEHTWNEACCKQNMLQTVFKDGKLLREQSLSEVRAVLHGGDF